MSPTVHRRALSAAATGCLLAALLGVPLTATAAESSVALGSTTLGNVFTPGTARTVTVSSADASVAWSLTDVTGVVISTGTVTPSSGDATITLPTSLADGWYALTATGSGGATAHTTLAVVPAPLAPSDPDYGQFGMGVHYKYAANTQTIPLLAPGGSQSIRNDVTWASVETTKGVYDWTEMHEWIDPVVALGMKPLLIADYGNRLYTGANGTAPTTPAARQAYANYVTAMAEEFGDEISGIEVWNEWNNGTGGNTVTDAANYVELLKVASPAIRAVDPDITILGPAVGTLTDGWAEQTFQLGALDYVDAMIAHPYHQPHTAIETEHRVTDLQALARQYNDGQDFPLWVTESGWPTGTNAQAVDERHQARYIAEFTALATHDGVERFYLYKLNNNRAGDIADKEDNFGVIYAPDDVRGDSVPKPAYASWATTTRLLTGAEPGARIDTAEGLHDLRFTSSDGTPLQMLWTEAGADQAVSMTASAPVKVLSMTGTESTLSPVGGVIRIQATEDPVWIVGATGEPVPIADAFQLDGAYAGDALTGSVTVANTDSRGVHSYKITVTGNDGSSVRKHLVVGAGATASANLALKAVKKVGSTPYTAQVTRDGRPYLTMSTAVAIEDPVGFTGRVDVADGAQTLQLSTTNNAGVPLDVERVDWKIGEATGTGLTGSSVPAKGMEKLSVPVADLEGKADWSATLVLADETTRSVKGVVYGLATGHRGAIVVDGIADDAVTARTAIDLDDAPWAPVRGGTDPRPEGFGGRAWYSHDDANLYLTAVIDDAVFTSKGTGGALYQGDSLQIGIAQGAPGTQTAWNEVGVALTPDGVGTYRWRDTATPTRVSIEGVQAAVVRDETAGTTTYEIALPWASLGVDPAGGVIASSIVVNNADGGSRIGFAEWGNGIATSKSSALFHPVQLEG
ncbi:MULTISPECIES: sugar-binding protein [unclassified Microbacterium]|uniref:sugar-binding protein n=1 Tax=unclassified Microbacterium TaxID=2609290 RepID=UPI0012F9222C|nr:sugar-binding protein [Microbacterium sp. MAH-37]MVQ41605.1 cellulase family glycosylhydrolase [Microbacterium sp. MAH-37]